MPSRSEQLSRNRRMPPIEAEVIDVTVKSEKRDGEPTPPKIRALLFTFFKSLIILTVIYYSAYVGVRTMWAQGTLYPQYPSEQPNDKP